MRNGIAGLDHVIVAVRDLEGARANWIRLGFTVTPRGRHIGQGTANYCIMFERDYLELLGAATPGDFGDRVAAFLERGEGAMATAFALGGPVEEARAALAELALQPSPARALGRELESPEGTVVPRFSLIDLPAEAIPGLDCFLCGHLTPELIRRPEWLAHPNGATGLRGVHVLVEDTAPLLPAYDRLFGIQHVTTTDAVAAVQIGSHRILFSSPDDFMTMHPGLQLTSDFTAPGIAALEIAVGSSIEAADYLRGRGVQFGEMPGRTLAIPAAEANGAILLLTEV